jgi:hypothetical protein
MMMGGKREVANVIEGEVPEKIGVALDGVCPA